MSDVIQGSAGNVTTPLTATVTALSDNGSGAIRVTTSAPHLFGNNDQVFLALTAFSGMFTITVISSTTFDLVGTTYSATSTGTASDLSLSPAVLVPTDGDPASAQLSGLLSSQQAILDRTQFLAKQLLGNGQQLELFSSSGSWTCPATTRWALVIGCGGGGGGGGGSNGSVSAAMQAVGGGGGEGAPFVCTPVAVSPGHTYTVTVGAGGSGGAGGTFVAPSGVAGLIGAQSAFGPVPMPGGQGGHGNEASGDWGGATNLVAALGGSGLVSGATNPQPGPAEWPFVTGSGTSVPIFPAVPGGGGHSFAFSAGTFPWTGQRALAGGQGGAAGSNGAAHSTNVGGAGGGGGGGGGGGATAGAGGAGGAAAATTGVAGVAGATAGAGTGGGGGGGGGGGAAATTPGTGGVGGTGGTGFVVVFWTQGVA